MIDPQARNSACRRPLDYVGCIEAAAKTDLEDACAGRGSGEGEERYRARDLEKARLDLHADIEHFIEKRGEPIVLDEPAGNSDPFVEANQMRAGEDVDLVAGGFEPSAKEGAHRAFAVRPGDVEHRRKPVLRTPEAVEQRVDAIEPEPVTRGRKFGEPVELGLDVPVRRPREIGHQAAAFDSGAR
jgi:hypothetical protein